MISLLELCQITGEAVAVKQTLLAVSWRLQEMKPRGVVLNHMSSEEKGRVLVSQEYTSKVVTYRLLCSRKVAGGLIGVGGGLVKCLEVETGASIRISKPLATPTERIATITAREVYHCSTEVLVPTFRMLPMFSFGYLLTSHLYCIFSYMSSCSPQNHSLLHKMQSCVFFLDL